MEMVMFYLCGLLVLGSLAYAALSLAPRAPTSGKDLAQIDEISQLSAGKSFIELGCGTSIVCTYIARAHPDCKVVGLELAWPLFVYSWVKQKIWGPKNLSIKYGDVLKKDLSAYEVWYIFGLPKTINAHFKGKAENELPPGGVLLSYLFDIVGWQGGVTEHIPLQKGAGIIHRFTKKKNS